jgi:gluconokinase
MLPFAIVVMGVSGCGKSTVASSLAARLHWDFAEADTFHSAANVRKMQSGMPLGDADRWPWLDAIAAWIDGERREGRHCIVACSALKRAYRERLARGQDDVKFVYLRGSYETIAGRLAGRSGHYMPLSLLKSQFDTLEEPAADENAITLPIERAPGELVDAIAMPFGLRAS